MLLFSKAYFHSRQTVGLLSRVHYMSQGHARIVCVCECVCMLLSAHFLHSRLAYRWLSPSMQNSLVGGRAVAQGTGYRWHRGHRQVLSLCVCVRLVRTIPLPQRCNHTKAWLGTYANRWAYEVVTQLTSHPHFSSIPIPTHRISPVPPLIKTWVSDSMFALIFNDH